MAETVLNRIINSRIKKSQEVREHTVNLEMPSNATIETIKQALVEKLHGVISDEEIDKAAQNVLEKVRGAGSAVTSRIKKAGIGDTNDWNQEEGVERGVSDPYEKVVNEISDIFATHDVLMKSEFEQIAKDLDTAFGGQITKRKNKVQKEI